MNSSRNSIKEHGYVPNLRLSQRRVERSNTVDPKINNSKDKVTKIKSVHDDSSAYYPPQQLKSQYKIPANAEVTKKMAILQLQDWQFRNKWKEVLRLTSSLIKFVGGFNPQPISIAGHQLILNPSFMRSLFKIICECPTVCPRFSRELLQTKFKVCFERGRKKTNVVKQDILIKRSSLLNNLKRDSLDLLHSRQKQRALRTTKDEPSQKLNIFANKSRPLEKNIPSLQPLHEPLLIEIFQAVPLKKFVDKHMVKLVQVIQDFTYFKVQLVEEQGKLIIATELKIFNRVSIEKEAQKAQNIKEELNRIVDKYGKNGLQILAPKQKLNKL